MKNLELHAKNRENINCLKVENQNIEYLENLKINKEIYVGVPILAIAFAEILIYSHHSHGIGEALWIHMAILMWLSLSIIFMKDEYYYKSYQALMLLPLLRLVNFFMPIFFDVTLYSFIFFYAPLAVPIMIVVTYQQLTREDLGITFKKIWFYLCLSVFLGFGFGMLEYVIIQPGYLIPNLSPLNLLKLTVVMVFFVGLIEEMIFRSILQTRLSIIFGASGGILLSGILFGLMHSGYGTFYEVLYTSFVGIFMGYMFYKTRSLPLIALTHGFVNVFLFGVIPHL